MISSTETPVRQIFDYPNMTKTVFFRTLGIPVATHAVRDWNPTMDRNHSGWI
jgi:hypothetical protein